MSFLKKIVLAMFLTLIFVPANAKLLMQNKATMTAFPSPNPGTDVLTVNDGNSYYFSGTSTPSWIHYTTDNGISTSTPTNTPSSTSTPTMTNTTTATRTQTSTNTATNTATQTATSTATNTNTNTATVTQTQTQTNTVTTIPSLIIHNQDAIVVYQTGSNIPVITPSPTWTPIQGTVINPNLSVIATPSVFNSQNGDYFAASNNSIVLAAGVTYMYFAQDTLVGLSGQPAQIGIVVGSVNGTGNNTPPTQPTVLGGITISQSSSMTTGYTIGSTASVMGLMAGPATLFAIPWSNSSGSNTVTITVSIVAVPHI